MSNPKLATVQRTVPEHKKEPEGLTILQNVVAAGKLCPEVQNDPVAVHALAALEGAVTTADGSLTKKLGLATALIAAIKLLHADYYAALVASRTYESAVGGIAKGNAAIINKAGLKARLPVASQTALGKVTVVHTKAGKHSAESILSWPPGPAATGYAIEVNFTPQNPTGPWTALTSGTGRRRTVKAPVPGSQFLARVASLGSGGTQSEWSDAILCTTAF